MSFSLNQKLAAGAFLLSFLALVTSLIFPIPVSLRGPEYISVTELAHSIKNRDELTLIDVRPEQAFNEFHLPTARHIPTSKLKNEKLSYTQAVVFYSGDDSLSIQAWQAFKKRGHDNISVLRGGAHDWHERILYPRMPLQIPPTQISLANEIKELSAFFGGRPRYVEDHHVLGYYFRKQNKTQTKRSQKLMRMGC
ncbi:MAG: rhodanese-like domain-containing protein [Balneolaceae bacterium]|nr:rhodanese-like domain-containing protein [Balneolaceae bacterium]